MDYIYSVSQKNCAKLFLSELRQISTTMKVIICNNLSHDLISTQ